MVDRKKCAGWGNFVELLGFMLIPCGGKGNAAFNVLKTGFASAD